MATAKYPTSLFVATSFIILFCSTADCVDKVSTRLGQPCARDENCASVTNARCWRGVCVCQQDYIQLDNTTCLPPTLLGFGCGHTAQCEARVRHSACIHGVCRCGAGFVSYRRHTCLKAVPINAICYTQEQCSEAVEHSVCDFLIPRILGRCVCKKGYWMVNGRCRNTAPVVEPVTLGQKCVSSAECRAADPDTRCSRGRCLCRYPTFRCRASRNGCHPDTFQCRSTPRCISWYFVCNGNDDCEDGSDEANCHHSNGVVMAASRSRDVTCPHTAIHCDRNSCVGRASVCDGINNCPNGADEIGCHSNTVQTKWWRPLNKMSGKSNKFVSVFNSITSQKLSINSTKSGAGSCPPNSFRCQTGECRPLSIFCNGVLDCIDGSDEPEEICRQGSSASTICPFRCGNGRCRSTAVLCSGTNGCGDNSDELPCTVCKCANKTEFESRRSNVFNPGAVFHTQEIFRELHKEKLSK